MTGPVGLDGSKPGAATRIIEPGAAAKLNVTFDPIGRKGKIRKIVSVYSNDPARPVQEVNVYATVKHSIKVRPTLRMETILFSKRCRKCHAEQGRGEKGKFLYDAICAFCHGMRGEGWSTRPFKKRSDSYVRSWIAFGKPGTGMAGYSKSRGGPLDAGQIESLVSYVQRLAASPRE